MPHLSPDLAHHQVTPRDDGEGDASQRRCTQACGQLDGEGGGRRGRKEDKQQEKCYSRKMPVAGSCAYPGVDDGNRLVEAVESKVQVKNNIRNDQGKDGGGR